MHTCASVPVCVCMSVCACAYLDVSYIHMCVCVCVFTFNCMSARLWSLECTRATEVVINFLLAQSKNKTE